MGRQCLLQADKLVVTNCISLRTLFTGGAIVKNPPPNAGDAEIWIRSLGWEDPPEEGVAIHSSIIAWSIPRTEESGGLYSPRGHIESYVTERLYTLLHVALPVIVVQSLSHI